MVAYYDTVTGKFYNFDVGGVIPSITDDFVMVDATAYYDLLAQTYADSSKTITFDVGTSGLTLSEVPSLTLSQQQQISNFQGSVYNFLNETSVTFGYFDIQDAISYRNSGIVARRSEAIAFNTWRDHTLALMYDNIYSFTADGITLPSVAAGSFTGQAGYTEFSVSPTPITFFGDGDAGYHITDLENRIFTAWINVNHQGINSGLGQSIQIPFPSGNITDIYSISGIVDQGSQTSDWLNANYSLKIKFSGTANSFGVQTEFDYLIHSLDGYSTTYNGLISRFTIIGGY